MKTKGSYSPGWKENFLHYFDFKSLSPRLETGRGKSGKGREGINPNGKGKGPGLKIIGKRKDWELKLKKAKGKKRD